MSKLMIITTSMSGHMQCGTRVCLAWLMQARRKKRGQALEDNPNPF
jgi:hypothetical protein